MRATSYPLLLAAGLGVLGCASVVSLPPEPDGGAGGAGGSSEHFGATVLVPDVALALAVSGGYVYYLTADAIKKVPTSGGSPVTIVTTSPGTQSPSLALDATSVYWKTLLPGADGALWKAGLDGSGVTQLHTEADLAPQHLAVSASTVWWLDAKQDQPPTGPTLRRMDLDGSNAAVWTSDGMSVSSDVVVDATSTYYSRGDCIDYVLQDSGGPSCHTFPGGDRFTLAAGTLYVIVTEPDPGRQIPAGSLVAETGDGALSQALILAPVDPGSTVAADGAGVYWTRGSGAVWGAGLDGSGAHVVASDVPLPSAPIALDANGVYWASSAGVLRANR